MGLFSKKNKEFSGSPTADDANDNNNGSRHNTLHKRPPTNDTPTTATADGMHPDSALGTIPRGRSVSPTGGRTAAGAGTGAVAGAGAGQSYEDGGMGPAGTRRADLAAGGAGGGMNDPYASNNSGSQPATMSHQRDLATGNPGVMSNQIYDKNQTGGIAGPPAGNYGPGVGNTTGQPAGHNNHTGAALGVAGAGVGLAAAEHHHHANNNNNNNNAGMTNPNQAGAGAGQNFSNDPNLKQYMQPSPLDALGQNATRGGPMGATGASQHGFEKETMESARMKVRAAEEAETRALALVAEARMAAKEAREIIERLAAQAEQEAQLAALKQKDAAGLREQTEHLGRV